MSGKLEGYCEICKKQVYSNQLFVAENEHNDEKLYHFSCKNHKKENSSDSNG